MATFNHTRGDSPRTPCAKCAPQCSNWLECPFTDSLMCRDCKQRVSLQWLQSASERGEEHVCRAPASGPFAEGAHVQAGRAVYLSRFGDADLRAECERRGMTSWDHENLRESNAVATRSALKALAERDEWKRKAEAAENLCRRMGAIAEGCPDHECAACETHVHANRSVISEARALGRKSPRPEFHGGAIDEQMRKYESGPGIATMRPDNAQWGVSDEDRLCDDDDGTPLKSTRAK